MYRLDHASPIPLYIQVIRQIQEDIEKGTFQDGDQIPAETVLAREFGVSRITVTNAIQKLVQDGVLYRIQGKGTFVATSRQVEHPLTSLISFTEQITGRGLVPRNLLIAFDLVEPLGQIAEKLNLPQGSKTWKIKRVRYANQEPIAIQTAYLPQHLFAKVKKEDVESGSLYQLLKERYHIEMNEAEEVYKVTTIRNKEEAELLNIPIESAVLHGIRVSTLKDQRKFEYTESILRGDRYVLSAKIKI